MHLVNRFSTSSSIFLFAVVLFSFLTPVQVKAYLIQQNTPTLGTINFGLNGSPVTHSNYGSHNDGALSYVKKYIRYIGSGNLSTTTLQLRLRSGNFGDRDCYSATHTLSDWGITSSYSTSSLSITGFNGSQCNILQDGGNYSLRVITNKLPTSDFQVAGGSSDWFQSFSDSPFYAKLEHTDDGTLAIYSSTSTSSALLKELPEDWVLYMATTSSNNSPIISDGYYWYGVIDPTDNVMGWMTAGTASSSELFLHYDGSSQVGFASSSAVYIATSSRPDLVLSIIDHYFNNASTTYSLYSSDDHTNISLLNYGGFEKKVIWGIAAQESGSSFNNESVSYDYGHGVMQLTFNAWSHEPSDPHATFDNRGYSTGLVIPPCQSLNSDDYVNCYTNAGIADTNPKQYIQYGGISGNPVYKQYANTEQSFYANIKDGMGVLANKFSLYSTISTSTTIGSTTYSAAERKDILATESYNGACGYVDNVAYKLDDITPYFPSATTSDITTLRSKFHEAGANAICAQLHSPAVLSIEDKEGRLVGIFHGKSRNDFPLAVFSKEEKFVKILSPETNEYVYKVEGLEKGTYGLDIILKKGKEYTIFKSRDIPITKNEVHTYTINERQAEDTEPIVIVSVDEEGDGEIDYTFASDLSLTKEEFVTEATQSEVR